MENIVLKCPSCNGQMMLTEAKQGDKIAKCEYCNTLVDLPDAAQKQGFNLIDFFKGFNLDGIKNGTTTTTTTTTIVTKDGKELSSADKEKLNVELERIKAKLRQGKLSLDDFDEVDGNIDASE